MYSFNNTLPYLAGEHIGYQKGVSLLVMLYLLSVIVRKTITQKDPEIKPRLNGDLNNSVLNSKDK